MSIVGFGCGLGSRAGKILAIGPVLTSLNYSVVDVAGGASVTITGTNLGSATSCTVGGTSASITANTSTSLTFTMPAKSAGSYLVQVTTPGGSSNTLSIQAFAPSTLSNQVGWWRNYAGAPWVDGSPSPVNLAAGSAAPGTSSLNGNGIATFNASTQSFTYGTTMDRYTNVDPNMRECGAALINIAGAVADPGAGNRFTANAIVGEAAGVWAITVFTQSSGTVYKLCHYALGSTTVETLITILNSQWVFAQWGYDGANLWVKVGGSARVNATWASSSGQPYPTGRTMKLGAGNSALFNGSMAEVVQYNADQTDTNLGLVRQYMESRYALTPGSLT